VNLFIAALSVAAKIRLEPSLGVRLSSGIAWLPLLLLTALSGELVDGGTVAVSLCVGRPYPAFCPSLY
jgi:hypothetical protein